VDYEGTGRKLGVGMKVLGRMAKQRIETGSVTGTVPPATNDPAPKPPDPRPPIAEPIKAAARGAKVAREGGRRFGQAIWGPFTRAGHVLWLEISGVFFGLFAAFFFETAFRLRGGFHGGPDKDHFWLFLIMGVLFAYFCVSSFVRARRRGKR
jgi:hypothetical protein